jgi:hypothetical protein
VTEQADDLVDVLLAIARGERNAARAGLRALVMQHPKDDLAAALARFVDQSEAADVYGAPTAFQAFIDHGDNPALYDSTIAHVRQRLAETRPRALIDIGAGDGRVTRAVVPDSVNHITLIEPSDALLDDAAAGTGWPVPPHRFAGTLRSFVENDSTQQPADETVTMSTFAMSTMSPSERTELLRRLSTLADRLLIVEFDVPDVEDRSPQHAHYCVQRYRRGIAEYAEHRDVIDGFLMPVLVGQFDPTAARHTFEQSAGSWQRSLATAGWSSTALPIHDYWWAPATLFDATTDASKRSH